MFKVGDKVKCIRAKNFNNNLVIGNIYEITDVNEGGVYVKIKNFDYFYLSNRFEFYSRPFGHSIEANPQVIKNENVAPFDVDWTLVEECSKENSEHTLIDPRTGEEYHYQVHKEHVSLMKQMKARGRFIIVWSASGHQWADTIVKALKLESFVDLVMTKPNCYVDDKPITDWCNQVYLKRKDKK